MYYFREVLTLTKDTQDGKVSYQLPIYFSNRADVQIFDFFVVQNLSGWKEFSLDHYVRYGQQFQKLANGNYETSKNRNRTYQDADKSTRFCSIYSVKAKNMNTDEEEVIDLQFTFPVGRHGATLFLYLMPSLAKKAVRVEHLTLSKKGEWINVNIIPARLEEALSAGDSVDGTNNVNTATVSVEENVNNKVVITGNNSEQSTFNVITKGEQNNVTLRNQSDTTPQDIFDELTTKLDY